MGYRGIPGPLALVQSRGNSEASLDGLGVSRLRASPGDVCVSGRHRVLPSGERLYRSSCFPWRSGRRRVLVSVVSHCVVQVLFFVTAFHVRASGLWLFMCRQYKWLSPDGRELVGALGQFWSSALGGLLIDSLIVVLFRWASKPSLYRRWYGIGTCRGESPIC